MTADYLPNKFLPNADPDVVGEYLRDIFFDQDKGYGCYSTFEFRQGVKSLPDEDLVYRDGWMDDRTKWTCAEYGGIKMRYFWDGDGTLEFHLPDGRIYQNTDCKKARYWELVGPESTF